MAICSQTIKDLPDQLEQLFNPVVGRIISSQKRVIYRCRRSSTIIPFAPKSGMERARMRPAQAAVPPPLLQPAQHVKAPTPFKTMFDGTA
ncbi:hypothetical protein E2320_005024, partial [Naja naja]